MSLHIKIELPIVTILAIQDAAKLADDTKALENVRHMTDRAIIDAVKEIPLDVIQKAIVATPTLPMPTINEKIQHSALQKIKTEEGRIEIFLREMTGKEHALNVQHDATIARVKERVEERIGIPPVTQRFIYGGKQMQDHKKLDELGVEDGSVLHLVLACRGS